MRSRSPLLFVGVLGALVLSACSVGEAPAATVGDARITDAELRADVPLYEFLAQLSGAPCGSPVGDESAGAACTRFTLTNDIREEIAKAYAVEHDLVVASDDIDSAIAQVEQNLGGPEALDQQLESGGLVRADLESLARRLLLVNEVQRAVTDERITDEQLRETYDQNVQQFTTVEVSHILVETEREAHQIAEEATPQTFAELAADRSIDPQSAQNGGSLGTYSEAQFLQTFDPTFAGAALALDVGQISAPVQTQFGWHVIELLRRDTATFEDVRDQLVGARSGEVFGEWLAEQIRALDVEVNPRYGRLDRSTGDVVSVRSTEASPSASASPEDDPGGATGTTGSTGP